MAAQTAGGGRGSGGIEPFAPSSTAVPARPEAAVPLQWRLLRMIPADSVPAEGRPLRDGAADARALPLDGQLHGFCRAVHRKLEAACAAALQLRAAAERPEAEAPARRGCPGESGTGAIAPLGCSAVEPGFSRSSGTSARAAAAAAPEWAARLRGELRRLKERTAAVRTAPREKKRTCSRDSTLRRGTGLRVDQLHRQGAVAGAGYWWRPLRGSLLQSLESAPQPAPQFHFKELPPASVPAGPQRQAAALRRSAVHQGVPAPARGDRPHRSQEQVICRVAGSGMGLVLQGVFARWQAAQERARQRLIGVERLLVVLSAELWALQGAERFGRCGIEAEAYASLCAAWGDAADAAWKLRAGPSAGAGRRLESSPTAAEAGARGSSTREGSAQQGNLAAAAPEEREDGAAPLAVREVAAQESSCRAEGALSPRAAVCPAQTVCSRIPQRLHITVPISIPVLEVPVQRSPAAGRRLTYAERSALLRGAAQALWDLYRTLHAHRELAPTRRRTAMLEAAPSDAPESAPALTASRRRCGAAVGAARGAACGFPSEPADAPRLQPIRAEMFGPLGAPGVVSASAAAASTHALGAIEAREGRLRSAIEQQAAALAPALELAADCLGGLLRAASEAAAAADALQREREEREREQQQRQRADQQERRRQRQRQREVQRNALLQEARVMRHDVRIPGGGPLGSGGFASVRVGFYRGTKVAVKQAKPRPGRSSASVKEAMTEEARVLLRLRHPNIVQVLGWYDADHGLAILMECCEDNMQRYGEAQLRLGGVQWRAKLLWGLQLARALEHLHALQIAHRDVKPENLLVVRAEARDVVLKLTDFGLASHINDDDDLEAEEGSAGGEYQSPAAQLSAAYCSGTRAFIAPECWRQRSGERIVRAAGDVYASGITMTYFISGRTALRPRSSPRSWSGPPELRGRRAVPQC